MIPQLVTGQCPLLQVQDQDAALVRVQQPDLPIAPFKLENQPEARERSVNNALQLQIYDRILLLGKLIQSAEGTHALLLSENKVLKQQITERSESLEKEWLGAAEQLSVKVDTFYRSANAFFKRFSPENQVATQIQNSLKERLKCGVPNKMWLMFQGYYFCGNFEGDEPVDWFWYHSPEVDKILPAIEQLHLTLKAQVKAEIQKIRNEILIEEPKTQATLLNPNEAVVIDEGDMLQAYLQGREDEIAFLEERNLPLRNANAHLEKKKIELMNMDKRFLAIFYRCLDPCFKWVECTKKMVELFKTNCKDFPQKCDRIAPHCNVPIGEASEYTRGHLLITLFLQHLKEIEPLLEALPKKDPI